MSNYLPELWLEANRALLDWRDRLLARPVELNIKAVQTGQLALLSGLRLWSLCEQNLPFWVDLTVGQVLSEANVLEPEALLKLVTHISRPPSLDLLVGRLADEIEQAGGVGHSVAIRGSGGYLRQIGEGSQVVTANLRGAFQTQKCLQLEFFVAATTNILPPSSFAKGSL
ncbi:MAG: hypothetical protein U0401_05210 [Anaerolineae bacterium]